jgi:transcription elongation factor Elf1
MAYLNIQGDTCPKCGSQKTVETSRAEGCSYPERKVFLKCYNCGAETSYGIYKLMGNTLVKVGGWADPGPE